MHRGLLLKRVLLIVAALAVAGATYAATASGGQQAAPTAKQFKALKKQVTALGHTVTGLKATVASEQATISSLNSQLTALKTDETAVKTTVNKDDGFITGCLFAGGVVGISQYGDPAGTFGYAYQDSSGSSLTSALDLDSSSTAGGFFQLIAKSCVSSSGVPHKAGILMERPQSTFPLKSR